MAAKLDTRVFHGLSYGLYMVTSRDNARLNGRMINTAIQVISKPARVAVNTNKKNFTHALITNSGIFPLSLLEEATPLAFICPFDFKSERDIEKFARVQFKTGVTGEPLVIEHAMSVMEANVIDKINLGGHNIFVGEVISSKVLKEGRPLTYHYYHENLKGKSPPNAPTFNKS